MNNIIKISLIFTFAFLVMAALPTNNVSAWGDSGCGSCDGGDGGRDGEPHNYPQPVAVCKYLEANKTTLPAGGGDVKLSWKTVNATKVTLTGFGQVKSENTKTVFVKDDKTFTLTAYGTGGNDTCTVKIKVEKEVPKLDAVCKYLEADKTTLPAGGGNVKLSWATKNAKSVFISGIGEVKDTGSVTVFVKNTKTFTLTAKGTGADDTCAVTITVKDEPEDKPAVCQFLTASKTTVKEGGENVTLSWATKDATSVFISGIGEVAKSGTKTVFVDQDTTFTLKAKGTGGNDTCAVTITVKDTPNIPTPRCDYFRIDGDYDVEEGDEITLEWATTNADDVRITPDIGDVASDGSEEVTVYDDTTFTLRARNTDSGDEATCTVTVRVDEDEDEDDDEDAPRCEIDISRTRVNRGDRVTLSWETTDADRVRITDDRGNTIVNTTKSSLMDGEIDLIINQTTEFTLNARGDGGSRTCRVTVKTDDIAVYEHRDQGYVIALTSVPYTGFEAGPILTFVFYALLTLWALFIAYVLVIKKGAILGFSLYKQGGVSESDLENRKKVEALVAKYSGLK